MSINSSQPSIIKGQLLIPKILYHSTYNITIYAKYVCIIGGLCRLTSVVLY